MMRGAMVVLWLLACLFVQAGVAAIEDYAFADAEQEARYHRLTDEMRCPMCLNSNVAGSDAPIAADLRAEVLRQLRAGRSDDEIMTFMKARYGDFITYRPPLNRGTALLWFGPLALLLAGFIVLRRLLGAVRSGQPAQGELNDEERGRLQALLDEDKESPRR
jgi:cytochrome c-type biogenesis protein CcmH